MTAPHVGLLLTELSGQMVAATGGHEVESMTEFGDLLDVLPTVLHTVWQTFDALAKGTEELPVDPVVLQTLERLSSTVLAAATASQGMSQTFRATHAKELNRLENPRPGEHKWDVEANR